MTEVRSPSLSEHRDTLAALDHDITAAVRAPTYALYAPLHPADPPQRIVTDLAYGPAERNLLDVHLPTHDPQGAPVLLFVHGGGFVGGDKGSPGRPFYYNLGRYAVEAGFVGVNMTYRLAPGSRFPAGSDDVASALDWVHAHIAEYGGDPDGVVVMGHSAGATHVASFLARRAPSATDGLAGAVLSSGAYDPSAMRASPEQSAYYGEDDAAYAGYSSIPGVAAFDLPLMVVVAEFDPTDRHRQAIDLIRACLDAGRPFPDFVETSGHNHFSSTWHLGTSDTWYGTRLADFVTRAARRRA